MKRRLLLALSLGCLVLGAGVTWWLQNDPQARAIRHIHRQLDDLATEVSCSPNEAVLRRLSYPSRVARFFTDPTELDVGDGERTLRGKHTRSYLEEIAAGTRAAFQGLRVQFLDVKITLLDPHHATAYLTAKIEFATDKDYSIQEFQLSLAEQNGDWLIEKSESVRTMIP